MKTGIYLIAILLGVLVSSTGYAEQTCVSSVSEFNAQSSKFPAAVQPLPALLATDGMFVTAGLKIKAVGDKLKLEGYVWQPGDIYVDDVYVSKACFDGKTFDITMENGKTYSAKVKGKDAVSIQGVTFEKSNEKKFASIVNKVTDALSKKSNVSGGVK